MKKITVSLLSALVTMGAMAADPIQSATYGQIDRIYLFSPELSDTITIDVLTPENYSSDNETPYPVLYMHDGQNLFDASTTWNHQAWEMDSVVGVLTESNQIIPPVIVGIHSKSETRLGDLMPEKALKEAFGQDREFKIGNYTIDIRGDRYGRFITETLKPLIDSTYNVSSDPKLTAVAGSSMGGLISIYLICEYPEIFGNAACLSTHWPGNPEGGWPLEQAMNDYIIGHLPDPATHKLYFDHGTEDIDAYYAPGEELVMASLTANGYTLGENLIELTDTGAGHNEKSWKNRVATPLIMFFPKN